MSGMSGLVDWRLLACAVIGIVGFGGSTVLALWLLDPWESIGPWGQLGLIATPSVIGCVAYVVLAWLDDKRQR